MLKFVVSMSTDWTDTEYELIEAKDIKEATLIAEELALENYNSYSNLWSEDKELDESEGFEWNDGEHYSFDVEEYNPEKHDNLIM